MSLVKEETGCHIHFPDSNRNNQAEKSNQVSIAGQPAGVESARVRMRELLPLVLMFELPIAGILQPIPDPNFPTIYLANAIPVSTQLDIASQHHLFMMGRNGSNIKHIMQRTDAQIHFPDPKNPLKKSTVYLQDTIKSVCLARQYLMGCLPLVLMFDMKKEIDVEPQYITQLMEQLDVFISIKPKPKQPSKSVIVKSVERNALNMYEARKCLLGLDSSGVAITSHSTLSCPMSYHALEILTVGLGLTVLGLLGPNALSVKSTAAQNSLLNALNSTVSPLHSPSSATTSPTLWAASLANTSGVPNYGQNTPSPPPGLTPVDLHMNSIYPECKKFTSPLNGHVKPSNMKYGSISTSSLGDKVINTHLPETAMTSNNRSPPVQTNAKSGSEGGNDAFVEMLNSAKAPCAKRQTVELIQGTKNSHLHSSERLLSDSEMSPADGPVTDKKAPRSEGAAERAAQQNSERAYDYEQKKLLQQVSSALLLLLTEVRTPTNTWSGLGFYKSMPAETIKELRRANHVSYKPTMSTTYEAPSMSLSRSNRKQLGSGIDSDNWRERNGIDSSHDYSSSIGSPKRKQNKSEHYLSSSNYKDCISSLTGSNGCSFKGSDLSELFSKLGLGKYTDIFQQQEIDLQKFLTLTDQDLKEL
uniref:SAM domain-containing protein n=1 Tax=Pyxicephalus adspersus TaxID=30357 RepID=A0AAV2ZJS6_PYXAD|nr:TPA: hypothetical protein GDO54_017107 [Pyxicephalus adspersus]